MDGFEHLKIYFLSTTGNWSGSSARHSLESERAKSLGAVSQRSMGTDSGRESPTPTADE